VGITFKLRKDGQYHVKVRRPCSMHATMTLVSRLNRSGCRWHPRMDGWVKCVHAWAALTCAWRVAGGGSAGDDRGRARRAVWGH
jgi:hypothetical protein